MSTTTNANSDPISYLMTVLKHTELPQPDYHKIAAECGINNANNAQKRFKRIVEDAGFRLVGKQVVDRAGGGGPKNENEPDDKKKPVATPKKPRATSTTSTPRRKKKSENDAGEGGGGGSVSAKKRVGKKRKLEDVKDEDSEGAGEVKAEADDGDEDDGEDVKHNVQTWVDGVDGGDGVDVGGKDGIDDAHEAVGEVED